MSNSDSSLIHTTGHRNYGSAQPNSGASQDDGAIDRWPHAPGFIAHNAGMLYIIASQFFFASMNLSVKMLNSLEPPVHAFEVIVVRMGITLICCVAYMIATGVPDPIIGPKGVRTLLVIRGITGFLGLVGLYSSLQYLSVADATVLTFLTPLTTALLDVSSLRRVTLSLKPSREFSVYLVLSSSLAPHFYSTPLLTNTTCRR